MDTNTNPFKQFVSYSSGGSSNSSIDSPSFNFSGMASTDEECYSVTQTGMLCVPIRTMNPTISGSIPDADFIFNKKTSSSHKGIFGVSADEYNEKAYRFLGNKKLIMIPFFTKNQVENFKISNIDSLNRDGYSNYYYDYTFSQTTGDLADNIKYESITNKNVHLVYFINEVEHPFESVVKLVFNHETIRLRITFLEPPCINDEFKLYSRKYFFKLDYRSVYSNPYVNTII